MHSRASVAVATVELLAHPIPLAASKELRFTWNLKGNLYHCILFCKYSDLYTAVEVVVY